MLYGLFGFFSSKNKKEPLEEKKVEAEKVRVNKLEEPDGLGSVCSIQDEEAMVNVNPDEYGE
jgi:hypothetical protein